MTHRPFVARWWPGQWGWKCTCGARSSVLDRWWHLPAFVDAVAHARTHRTST